MALRSLEKAFWAKSSRTNLRSPLNPVKSWRKIDPLRKIADLTTLVSWVIQFPINRSEYDSKIHNPYGPFPP